jgi:hypothetical protein
MLLNSGVVDAQTARDRAGRGRLAYRVDSRLDQPEDLGLPGAQPLESSSSAAFQPASHPRRHQSLL